MVHSWRWGSGGGGCCEGVGGGLSLIVVVAVYVVTVAVVDDDHPGLDPEAVAWLMFLAPALSPNPEVFVVVLSRFFYG